MALSERSRSLIPYPNGGPEKALRPGSKPEPQDDEVMPVSKTTHVWTTCENWHGATESRAIASPLKGPNRTSKTGVSGAIAGGHRQSRTRSNTVTMAPLRTKRINVSRSRRRQAKEECPRTKGIDLSEMKPKDPASWRVGRDTQAVGIDCVSPPSERYEAARTPTG